jgi:predicted phosphodiesterase
MDFTPPLRILSDLHVGHPAGLIRDIAELSPLLRGVHRVIFNGDSVEMRFLAEREIGHRNIREIGELCLANGTRPFFINGNHDPVASSASHLDLAGGEVLVTHGDMLFHDISPWSHEARIIGAAHDQLLAEFEEDALADFEKRLFALKKAALALEMHDLPIRPGPLAKLAVLLRESWPPWRPLLIIKCWIETPGEAERIARTFRPDAKFMIIGHTHWSGWWRRRGLTIINTGSYMAFSNRLMVDVTEKELQIRRVVRRGGEYHPGAVVERLALGSN